MKAILHKFPYSYMDYENVLLYREIQTFFPEAQIVEDYKSFIVLDNISTNDIPNLNKLTYITQVEFNNCIYKTLQFQFENSCSRENLKRQSTRYSTHGLHEYKGKYNPQVVHALLNMFNISHNNIVLDPFCGSGTTMLECQHLGIRAVGIDINPFAVFLSNTKLNALFLDCDKIYKQFILVTNKLLSLKCDESFFLKTDTRSIYLKKWLPAKELFLLENLLLYTENLESEVKQFLRVTASDLVREYSLQEPSDLRIRRRTSSFPSIPFVEAWEKNVLKYLGNIASIQRIYIRSNAKNYAINIDIKKATQDTFPEAFDIAITSPPYATALPYIDTQRISLVWLGLCPPDEIMLLESNLIGSRELYKQQKKDYTDLMISNASDLPPEIYEIINEINNSLSNKDGFRKQAMPTLLYRYFSDMNQMFIKVLHLIKSGGHYCLIVGHNRTTIGEKIFNLNTPKLLSILAEQCGWEIDELIPLQTYKRYGLNSKNAINHETLIILKKQSK